MDEKNRGAFYCEICDCELKDSANYREHINGKRHNRNKGISLKDFKDSTLEEVKEMLEKKIREARGLVDEIGESSQSEDEQ